MLFLNKGCHKCDTVLGFSKKRCHICDNHLNFITWSIIFYWCRICEITFRKLSHLRHHSRDKPIFDTCTIYCLKYITRCAIVYFLEVFKPFWKHHIMYDYKPFWKCHLRLLIYELSQHNYVFLWGVTNVASVYEWLKKCMHTDDSNFKIEWCRICDTICIIQAKTSFSKGKTSFLWDFLTTLHYM